MYCKVCWVFVMQPIQRAFLIFSEFPFRKGYVRVVFVCWAFVQTSEYEHGYCMSSTCWVRMRWSCRDIPVLPGGLCYVSDIGWLHNEGCMKIENACLLCITTLCLQFRNKGSLPATVVTSNSCLKYVTGCEWCYPTTVLLHMLLMWFDTISIKQSISHTQLFSNAGGRWEL